MFLHVDSEDSDQTSMGAQIILLVLSRGGSNHEIVALNALCTSVNGILVFVLFEINPREM